MALIAFANIRELRWRPANPEGRFPTPQEHVLHMALLATALVLIFA